MRFTAEEALEAQGTEDAIMITLIDANRICGQHSADIVGFLDEKYPAQRSPELFDAGDLFAWLGY